MRVISAELAEAVHYARRIEALGSDDQGTWSGGAWFRARSLPHVYDVNRLDVLEEGFGMSMEEVSAAADEIQAEPRFSTARATRKFCTAAPMETVNMSRSAWDRRSSG